MQRRFAMLFVLALAACGSTTDTGTTSVDMRGTWSYTGVQTSPVLNVSGILTIDQQSGKSFTGSAQFSETDVQGTIRIRTGQINGRVIGADAVDFDIFVEATARRHVGRVVADSMKGTWAVTGSNITGSFNARLIP